MIEVFANGLKFGAWTSVSVTRGLGNIAAAFQLRLANHDAQGERVRLFSGDLVEIDIDGIGAVKGFVGPESVSFDGGGASLSVSGNEITCDLVDCCATAQIEWLDKPADVIIADICREFGVSFFNPYGVDFGAKIKNFAVDPGTRAVDAISKLCRQRGFLPCSNGMGKVFVVKPSDCPRGPKLEEGVNIFSASANYNANALYSDYYVYGTGDAKKKIMAHKTDPTVRNRPLVIVDSDAVDKDTVEARAAWEMSIRRAKSISFDVSVNGWRRDESSLWEPGLICSIDSPALFVDEPVDMIVSQVNYDWGYGGETTTLKLVPVDSYEPEPETKKPQKVGSKKQKTPGVWAQISKAVHG